MQIKFDNKVNKVASYVFDEVLTMPVYNTVNKHWKWSLYPNESLLIEIFKKASEGWKSVLISERPQITQGANNPIDAFISEYSLPISDVYYTDAKSKVSTVVGSGSVIHFDNDLDFLKSLPDSVTGMYVPHPMTWLTEKDYVALNEAG